MLHDIMVKNMALRALLRWVVTFRDTADMEKDMKKEKMFPGHSNLKTKNLRKVFRSIQANGSTTRRRIQEETGLSWGAVPQKEISKMAAPGNRPQKSSWIPMIIT